MDKHKEIELINKGRQLEREEQEAQENLEYLDSHWQRIAGYYCAGNVFHLIEKNDKMFCHILRKVDYSHKTTFICYDLVLEFVKKMNGFVLGHKTAEFLEFCKMTKTEFIPKKELLTDAWYFGFLRYKVKFFTDKKKNRVLVFIVSPNSEVLFSIADRFGGCIQKRRNLFKLSLGDQKRVAQLCSFLLKEPRDLIEEERTLFKEKEQICLSNLTRKTKKTLLKS